MTLDEGQMVAAVAKVLGEINGGDDDADAPVAAADDDG